jgi:hypothetical protein
LRQQLWPARGRLCFHLFGLQGIQEKGLQSRSTTAFLFIVK